MKRLSIRPRPLDIYKKLPLVTSRQDLDGDEFVRGYASSGAAVKDLEQSESVSASPAKKVVAGSEIPTPEFLVVDSYERDYTRTFVQPQSYIRARPARSGSAQYCEYDLDDDDEHWLNKLNAERSILPAEKFELMLYNLEIIDQHRRPVAPVYGITVPVVLSKENSAEVLGGLSNSPAVLGAVFDYWKGKRESLQKPILRRLQPAPPVNDPSPFNVFRPREKINRPHTRRMQRRENDNQSFEKLRQVRHRLEQTSHIMRLIQEREKKKRELVQVESNIQRIELRLKVAQYVQHDSVRMEEEDGSPMPGRIAGVEDGHRLFLRTEHLNGHRRLISTSELTPPSSHATAVSEEREIRIPRRRPRFPPSRWKGGMKNLEPLEPSFLFTKPLDLRKLESAGIAIPFCFPGRIGRGGRIVFDRWNPFTEASLNFQAITQLPSHNHHSTSKPFATSVDKVPSSRQV